VTVEVPGAIAVSVYCGGDETTHVSGTEATLTPSERTCYVEAPLTPVMPLRGSFSVGSAASYRCERDNVALSCTPIGG
jgi:hypothetical protein